MMILYTYTIYAIYIVNHSRIRNYLFVDVKTNQIEINAGKEVLITFQNGFSITLNRKGNPYLYEWPKKEGNRNQI